MAEMDFETASGEELDRWYVEHPGDADESMEALRDRIVAQVEARVRAETVDREREAVAKALKDCAAQLVIDFPEQSGPYVAVMHFRDRYLAREYPAPAPSSVTLSDGSVVELRVASSGRRYLARPGSMEVIGNWRDLAITGADFDALKAFAATVEGR